MRKLLFVAVVFFFSASFAIAQEPAPRTADGHPDLSGVWWPGSDLRVQPLTPAPAAPGGQGRAGGPGRGGPPPRRAAFADNYTDAAKAKAKTLSDKDDPTLRCQSTAFGTLRVSLYNTGFVGQIIQTPKFLVLLSETNPTFRIVPTDGRPHRDDQPPVLARRLGRPLGRRHARRGHDELLRTGTGCTPKAKCPSTPRRMHIVERYRRINKDTMEVEATIEDPKVLTAPLMVPKQTLRLAPFDQIMALDCSGVESAAADGSGVEAELRQEVIVAPAAVHPQPQIRMPPDVHLQHVRAALRELADGVLAVRRRRLDGMFVDQPVASSS